MVWTTMTTILDQRQSHDAVQILADFSPPRGTDPSLLGEARGLDADLIAVAYNPGKSARVNSAFAAAWIKHTAGKEVTFSISTRDMNRLALQSMLMGADMMGLENVVALKGDAFTDDELSIIKPVDDYAPTGLIRAITEMNRGIDFKGRKMEGATNFCVGATIDLGREIDRQVQLTRKKIEAGAQFFFLQALFSPDRLVEFHERYAERYAERFTELICCGVQIIAEEGIVFGRVPEWVATSIQRGRSGEDIAVEMIARYREIGHHSIYLLAPIYKGGRRDYASCQRVIERARAL